MAGESAVYLRGSRPVSTDLTEAKKWREGGVVPLKFTLNRNEPILLELNTKSAVVADAHWNYDIIESRLKKSMFLHYEIFCKPLCTMCIQVKWV